MELGVPHALITPHKATDSVMPKKMARRRRYRSRPILAAQPPIFDSSVRKGSFLAPCNQNWPVGD
jgi:hypothetical protein